VELAEGEEAAEAYHARTGVRGARLEFAAAVADCDTAIRLRPDWATAYVSRAHARYHTKDGRAILDYVRALDIDPTAAEIGRVLTDHARGDAGLVLANCTKHLRADPNDVAALMRRGPTLLLLGDEAAASPDLDRAVGRLPRFRRHWEVVIRAVREARGLAIAVSEVTFEPDALLHGIVVG
jgi:tetratricopeptide (TPR) repeat protein